MSTRPVIFIGSNVLELPLHLKEVVEACWQMDCEPRLARVPASADDAAVASSLGGLEGATAYLGLFAFKYGPTLPRRDISLAEAEYDRAGELQLPRLVFLMHDDHPIRRADVEIGPGASRLQALKERMLRESTCATFQSPEDLRETVLWALVPFRPELAGTASPALGSEKTAYLQRLADQCRWIDLGGLAPQVGGELLRLPLDSVFIQLRARRNTSRPDELAREEERLRLDLEQRGAPADEVVRSMERLAARYEKGLAEPPREETVAVAEVLKHSRVVVLGDPGAGKTTLLRFVARALALRSPSLAPSFSAELFPVYIRLGEYDQYCDRQARVSLMEYAPIAANSRQLSLFPALLETEVAAGRCLFLLDGLDEIVRTDNRIEVRNRIEELARSHPRCRLLVTSRVVGYDHAPLPAGDQGFAHFTLAPFDDREIRRFAELWYDAVRLTGDVTDPTRQNAEALVQGIQSLEAVRRLATNPLLLTLIALIYWREVRLPRRRVDLYRSATRMLLTKWSQGRAANSRLSERDVTSRLMAVAFHLHLTSSTGLISRRDLERVLLGTKTEPGNNGVHEAEARREVEEFLRTQGQHVGLLLPRGLNDRNEEMFGFLHLTFQEYYAGRELARLWKQGRFKLGPFLHRPRWEEPILLACAHLSDEDDERAVNAFVLEILDAGSLYEKELRRDLLLAARCLADDAAVSGEVCKRIMQELGAAFSTSIAPLNEAIGKVLADMQGSRAESDAVRLLVGKCADGERHIRHWSVAVLARLGETAVTPESLSAMVELLSDPEPEIGTRAAGTLARLGTTETRAIAISALVRMLFDSNPNLHSLAANALARSGEGPARAEALSALARASCDPHPDIRYSATSALARLAGGSARSEALSFLLERLSDSDRSVRYQAADALARLGEGSARSEALSILVKMLHDPDPHARSLAAETLAQQSEEPARAEALSVLVAMLSDPDPNMRFQATAAMARLSKVTSIPEIVSSLASVMRGPAPIMRDLAAGALVQMGKGPIRSEILSTLELLLADPDPDVRFRSAKALIQSGNEAALPEVVSALRGMLNDLSDDVRYRVADALARLAEGPVRVEALSALAALLADPHPHVRCKAADALASLGEGIPRAEALDVLGEVLSHPDSDVRSEAAETLARQGEGKSRSEALSTLVKMLADPDLGARGEAAESLARLEEVAATKDILDQLARNILSPSVRGNVFEDSAYHSLQHLLLIYERNRGLEVLHGEFPAVRFQALTQWSNWLAGEGDEHEVSNLPLLATGFPILRVRKIRLRNIKVFADSGIVDLTGSDDQLPRPWSLVLGDNAAGKTTFLKCVALAAYGAGLANEIERRAASYLRVGASSGFIEVLFDVQVAPQATAAEVGSVVVGLEIRANETGFRPLEEKDLTLGERNAAVRLAALRNRSNLSFGLVCGYGATRGLTDEPNALIRESGKPVLDRVAPLFSAYAPLIDPDVLGKMLATGDLSNFRNAPARLDSGIRASLCEKLRKLLPEFGDLASDAPSRVELRGTSIPLRDLSDGYAGLLALVGHLLHHALAVGGWETDPTQAPGLVLIDEIDLHLHPAWQRRVAEDLRRTFPNMQFLATSHSPMVAGSVPGDSLLVLREGEAGMVVTAELPSVKGWRADQILTSDIFGLSTTRDLNTERLFEKYAGLLRERGPDDSEVKQLRKELSALLGLEGEGEVDRKTHELVEEVLAKRFERLDEKSRALLRAKADLLLTGGNAQP
jgi:HEAT repeat protein/energy-coupling factor transporter ATP-binding protein EcfA2